MKPLFNHPWQVTVQEAKAIQLQLAGQVVLQRYTHRLRTICAVDVSYGRFDKVGYGVLGWFAIARESESGRYDCRLEQIYTNISRVSFPYIPGYLSFREIPVLLPLFRQLPEKPDLLLVDGAGIAHPRRIGLAAHLGVIFDVPAIGCAKSHLFGSFTEPGQECGASAGLVHSGETIGYLLRSKPKTRPLFISPGHLTDNQSALAIVRDFCGKYCIPVPLRIVDLISKDLRKNPEKYREVSNTGVI